MATTEDKILSYMEETTKLLDEMTETREITKKIYDLQVIQAVLLSRNVALNPGDPLGVGCLRFLEDHARHILHDWETQDA